MQDLGRGGGQGKRGVGFRAALANRPRGTVSSVHHGQEERLSERGNRSQCFLAKNIGKGSKIVARVLGDGAKAPVRERSLGGSEEKKRKHLFIDIGLSQKQKGGRESLRK